jgi:glycosyltransferase involved in cell wall biosynthesis
MPLMSALPTSDRKRSPYREDAERLHAAIGHPRLGFFGVIDERLDAELIAAVADAAPNWQLVMAGPIVKIDPASLPHRANIHWLGQQPYEVLPHLVAQWDVCLLPFARNESTRFISPTKTLEYMAAEKPIVSTPIIDVVGLYGDSVTIAATAGEFISACAAGLAESVADRQLRIERMRGHVSRCTWDRTAREIHQEIEAILQVQSNAAAIAEIEHVRRPSSTLTAEALRVQAVDRVGSRATNEAVMPSAAAQ